MDCIGNTNDYVKTSRVLSVHIIWIYLFMLLVIYYLENKWWGTITYLSLHLFHPIPHDAWICYWLDWLYIYIYTHIYINIMMMFGDSIEYIYVIMMLGKSGEYIDDNIMFGDSRGYTSVMMMPYKSRGYIGDMMRLDDEDILILWWFLVCLEALFMLWWCLVSMKDILIIW